MLLGGILGGLGPEGVVGRLILGGRLDADALNSDGTLFRTSGEIVESVF